MHLEVTPVYPEIKNEKKVSEVTNTFSTAIVDQGNSVFWVHHD